MQAIALAYTDDKRFVTAQALAALRAHELHRLAPCVFLLTCTRCRRGRVFVSLLDVEHHLQPRNE